MTPKITQINKGAGLTRADFIEVLKTWEELYRDLEKGGFSGEMMISGLIRVASSFYVLDELVVTPAAYRIEKAKLLAQKSGDLHEIELNVSEAIHILTK